MDFTYTVETRKDPRRSWIGKRKQGRREEGGGGGMGIKGRWKKLTVVPWGAEFKLPVA